MDDIILIIYCIVDEFCKKFEPEWNKFLLSQGKNKRRRKHHMSLSEILTILVLFHVLNFRNFKHFYRFLQYYHAKDFPDLISYNRFVEIKSSFIIPLCIFFEAIKGKCDGVSYIDSTPITVCKNKRIYSHKVFKKLAKIGKSTMGWFYGFKLHMIINRSADILGVQLTTGNIDDRNVVKDLCKDVFGKVFGDKGYISKDLFSDLFKQGIEIITSLRKNMKPKIIGTQDSQHLSKRSLIESSFNVLKNSCHLEHSRHRSPLNFCVNIMGSLCGYVFRRLLPKISHTQNLIPISP